MLFVLSVGSRCGEPDRRRPDTGYGANHPVPAAPSCMAFCERLTDCVIALCGEDTMSPPPAGERDLVMASCNASCEPAEGEGEIAWSILHCMFESSCREVFDYDVCDVNGRYHCSPVDNGGAWR